MEKIVEQANHLKPEKGGGGKSQQVNYERDGAGSHDGY